MHTNYDDITSRISTQPRWFDEHAVPRYCEFDPSRSVSIHVGEIALVEVGCQRCSRLFCVAISAVNFVAASIADGIRTGSIAFGDPPVHLHSANLEPCTGDTMNSISRRVMEYWHRHDQQFIEGTRIKDIAFFEWTRDPSLALDLAAF